MSRSSLGQQVFWADLLLRVEKSQSALNHFTLLLFSSLDDSLPLSSTWCVIRDSHENLDSSWQLSFHWTSDAPIILSFKNYWNHLKLVNRINMENEWTSPTIKWIITIKTNNKKRHIEAVANACMHACSKNS